MHKLNRSKDFNKFKIILLVTIAVAVSILLLFLLFSAIFIANGGIRMNIKEGEVINKNGENGSICLHTESNRGSGEWINIFSYKCDEKVDWNQDYIDEDNHKQYIYDLISSGECVDVILQNKLIIIKKNPICVLFGVEVSKEKKYLVNEYGKFFEENEFLTYKSNRGIVYFGNSDFAEEYSIDLPKECIENKQQDNIHLIPKITITCQINPTTKVTFILNQGGYAAGIVRSETRKITSIVDWNVRYYDNKNSKVAYLPDRHSYFGGIIEVYFEPYSKTSQEYFEKILASLKANSEFSKQ